MIELYAVVLKTPSSGDWVDYGTLRTTPEGSRDAANEWYKGASRAWKNDNTPYRIRRFVLLEIEEYEKLMSSGEQPNVQPEGSSL